MKSKEEILNNYYSQGADGMPEIAADGLLKAMEEYRLQAEKAAFNAAREYKDGAIGGRYSFQTFEDYKASLIVPVAAPAEPDESAQIQFMADSILELFIPQDKSIQTLSFNIKTGGIPYTVNYEKSPEGFWVFKDYFNADLAD
ncbi:hypothetical protein IDJ77_21650 [Mucilaginibacter sp. ZT4R22]|uniref:Uncharacterized protein n=1 Tax=Mucilaginibacter pankratovii TaxID=2772110 RepID=A0ABR7WVX2_9SPHI|nr:hypothetical protein [Mucilaginibacter pankratovii]MBD1366433.1 hypothetical protein [Mucilaginibacter pankratovii]